MIREFIRAAGGPGRFIAASIIGTAFVFGAPWFLALVYVAFGGTP